jgi:hypothetical protein
MSQPNLTAEEYATIAALLRDTIAADRFPLSPRVRRWKAILDKLEPPAPKREPLPQLKPPGERAWWWRGCAGQNGDGNC